MGKKQLSETDIRTKFITPALVQAGWDVQTQIREEVCITNGKILVRGKKHKRGNARYADYILYHKPNIPIAVIEAKDNNHALGDGMQQALEYSEKYISAFLENWEEFETLKSAIPSGSDVHKQGKMGMSIRIGSFAQGVCIQDCHLPINSKKQLENVINGYRYASQRAPLIQQFLASL
jgi:hypothetical protein